MKSYDGSEFSSDLAPGGSKYEQLEKDVRDLLHEAYGEDVCTAISNVQSGSIQVTYEATVREDSSRTQSNLTASLREYLLAQPECQDETDCNQGKLEKILVPPDSDSVAGSSEKEYLGIGWKYWVVIMLSGVVVILFITAICIIICQSGPKKKQKDAEVYEEMEEEPIGKEEFPY